MRGRSLILAFHPTALLGAAQDHREKDTQRGLGGFQTSNSNRILHLETGLDWQKKIKVGT